jgi:hypothetical protein
MKDKGHAAQQQTQASMLEMKGGSKEERPMRRMLHVDIGTNIK